MMSLTVAYVEGVMPGKWLRAWEDRRRGGIRSIPVSEGEQEAMLRAGLADLAFVRLPIDRDGMSLIPLYDELPVAVAGEEHPIAAADELSLADLEDFDSPSGLPAGEAVAVVAAGAGVVVLPMSVARMHGRKDVVQRVIVDAPATTIGLAWMTANTTPDIEEFIGIVRGRTANSSRGSRPERTQSSPSPRAGRGRPGKGRRRG